MSKVSRKQTNQKANSKTRSRKRSISKNKAADPPKDEDSFASGSDIDAQYLDFLNTANEMAGQGDIKLAIRLLEDEINDRLDKYSSKDKGVWIYSKSIADICNNHASKLINYNQLDNAMEFLKIAKKYTEPLPNSNWGERKDWKLVRK